jgi:methylphosphotriester-DNA--protein-cysteine methyltransferase
VSDSLFERTTRVARRALRVRGAALAAVAAAATIVLAGGVVLAASAPPSPSGFWTQLAHKVGVTPATLRQDVRAVAEARFLQFAAAHHLTPQQIEAGRARIDHARFMVARAGRMHRMALWTTVIDTTAKTLHMTPAQVRAELRSGTTLAQMAVAHQSSEATLRAALAAALTARLSEMEARGTISPSMAAHWRSHAPTLIGRLMTRSFKWDKA